MLPYNVLLQLLALTTSLTSRCMTLLEGAAPMLLVPTSPHGAAFTVLSSSMADGHVGSVCGPGFSD